MSELEFWKDLGNIFDAVMNYQKKNVEFNNNFINPWIRLGNIFEREDESNDAVKAYQRATQIDPENAQNWVNLGDAQFRKEDFDAAIQAYRKAVALDPQAGWPVGNLALCLVTQGKIEEAIPLYKQSIGLLNDVKDKAICWNRLGNAYRKLNDYENAFLSFQKADQLDGGNTGFDDRLDETPPSLSVVAPEEILEQMTAEETETEPAMPELAQQPVEEIHQPEAEPAIINLTRVETSDNVIALAPNMEMKVDETTTDNATQSINETRVEQPENESVVVEEESPLSLHEKNFDILQVVEDVIAKVEQAYSETVEVVTETVEAVTEAVTEALNPEPEPVNENPVQEEGRHIPEWLVIRDSNVANEVQEEALQVESVTTLSDISQETVVNELTVNMDVVETYTDPLAAQLTTEPDLSRGSAHETIEAVQTDSKHEVEVKVDVTVELTESNSEETEIADETSASATDEQRAEMAYEEYLKDVIEPTNILTDHIDEIHSETPITKVSKNGDVRIAMDTKNAHVWNELGNIYLNAGSCDDAIASYRKAIELDRNFAWPYSNLALAYVQKERFAEAILFYQRGIELFTSDKDKAITWNRLGNVYRRINDYSTAIASYQTADELDPENATLSLRSSFGLLGNKFSDSKPALVE